MDTPVHFTRACPNKYTETRTMNVQQSATLLPALEGSTSTAAPLGSVKTRQASLGKSYDPFNGDQYLNLFKTLATDSPAESAAKAKAKAQEANAHLAALGHLHNEDEASVLAALPKMPVSAVELAQRAIQRTANLKLSEPCLPNPEEFLGTYAVAPGTGYAVTSFGIEPQDVVSASEVTPNIDVGKSGELSNAGVQTYLTLRKCNVTFRKGLIGFILKHIPGKVVYILTVSKNGIVRFHLPRGRNIFTKLVFAYADSEPGRFTWFKNLRHAIKYGCYCIGLFFRGKTPGSTENDGTQPVIMRFNRWAESVAPYWAAVNSTKSGGTTAS